ncbi:type I methionyl aminopeptidase [candidate division WWE3 bacterium]|nr:type I methionyl aminopeptidase [candidate division WWE3 bacterium]
MSRDHITIKSKGEIEIMAEAGIRAGQILETLIDSAKVGMKTLELEAIAAELLKKHQVTSSFKGYQGFPYNLVICLNDEVVHGMPSNRILASGDVLTIDFGCIYREFHADTAYTIQVGEIDDSVQSFLKTGEQAMHAGINQCVVGNHLGDIGYAMQSVVEGAGFNVVRAFVGHGVGKDLQEDPQVPGYGTPGRGYQLKEGLVLAIEIMYTMGDYEVEILDDDWTAVTADGSLSGMFEHTVAITSSGPRILTERPKERLKRSL